ncbi:MAG: sterol desaturase family protein [Alteromonadaceae bacterium]|nr:sterol desaturase family protein [Alteromonadaceae bacterium]
MSVADFLALDFLWRNVSELINYLFDANKRLYIVYILSALLLAIPVYRRTFSAGTGVGFFKYIFPWSIYSSQSARHDYALLVINKLIKSALFPFIVITMAPVAIGVSSGLEFIFNYHEPVVLSSSAIIAIFTLFLFIADDFTRFVLHYLLHRIPYFWEFHKVHHSAKVLTPFTIYRSHPVESLLYAVRMSLTQGFVVGCCYYLFGPTLKMFDILGANLFVFLFNFCGSNIRHSHIWLSWGDKIEGWFISPAQHQIHHSNKPKEFNSNFGSALAIWDRWFATLNKSSQVGELTFGLPVKNAGHDSGHSSLLQIYVEPFKKCGHRLLKKLTA